MPENGITHSMTTFETKRHIEIDENHQGINLTEFAIGIDEQTHNDQIVERFIRSISSLFDSLRDRVKAEPDKGYLKRAFNFDLLNITHFRKTDRQGTSDFLFEFINEPDWGNDRGDFAKLLDRYLEIHNELSANEFYILSKDWFGKEDDKIIEPDGWVYTYYFLIISVDRRSGLLTLTEWTYD